MDSAEFYIFLLIYLLSTCCLTTFYYIFRVKKPKILKIQFVLRILLISAFTIFLLEAMPYSVIDVREVPPFNMSLSITYWFLLSYITIVYELSKFEPKNKKNKNPQISNKISIKKEI